MSDKVEFRDQIACDICGRFGAFDFGKEKLCGDCYESRGSCCPEFCGDDACDADESDPKIPSKSAPTQS